MPPDECLLCSNIATYFYKAQRFLDKNPVLECFCQIHKYAEDHVRGQEWKISYEEYVAYLVMDS